MKFTPLIAAMSLAGAALQVAAAPIDSEASLVPRDTGTQPPSYVYASHTTYTTSNDFYGLITVTQGLGDPISTVAP